MSVSHGPHPCELRYIRAELVEVAKDFNTLRSYAVGYYTGSPEILRLERVEAELDLISGAKSGQDFVKKLFSRLLPYLDIESSTLKLFYIDHDLIYQHLPWTKSGAIQMID